MICALSILLFHQIAAPNERAFLENIRLLREDMHVGEIVTIESPPEASMRRLRSLINSVEDIAATVDGTRLKVVRYQ